MTRNRITRSYWGLVLVAAGVLFLARNLGLIDFHFSWRRYWPVFLILLGIAMVLKSMAGGSAGTQTKPDDHTGA